jgi:Carboxyl transferase domain
MRVAESENVMGWQPELDELRERERLARELGGADKVKRQHDSGKLTVRERIDALVDRGSFHEIGAIAGRAEYDKHGKLKKLVPSNCVMGRAQIDGRPVVVVGDDFTVRGGSADATIREKPLMAEQMAHDLRLPIIRIVEGSGGGGSVKTIETQGRANLPGRVGSNLPYYYTTANMGIVPVVALGLGSVAGLGAARMAASHYSVMTKETSALFVAGPPVVNALGQQQFDRFELGGWEIQTRCGAVDHAVDTEEEAFECTRRFLSYLPSSVYELPARGPRTDDPERRDEFLFEAIPRDRRKVYKMRPIVEAVVDQGSFFEMGRMFGRGIITGLARIDGLPVAVMASDPSSTAARGPPMSATRSSDSSISPRPSTCRSSICATAPASKSGSRPRNRRRSGRACARWRRSTSRACRGARSWCATCSASPARSISRRVGFRSATPGCRRAGAHCLWRAGSRPPTVPRSTPPPTATRRSPRSRSGCSFCARRSAPPRRSGSRRSSTRAIPAASPSNSPIQPKSCASRASAASACGRSLSLRDEMLPRRRSSQ